MSLSDDLLSSAGRVPDITPDGLRNARAALDTTIADVSVRQEPDRKLTGRWHGGVLSDWRGRTLAGVTAVAAAAAVFVAVTAAPSPHTGTPAAGSHVKPTVKATGKPKSSFRVGFSAPTSNATAAQLLDEAATAAGAQQGWPDAAYWYTESENTSLLTGKSGYSVNWSDRHGNGVTASSGTPIPEQTAAIPSSSSLPPGSTAARAIPVAGDNAPFYGYTWSQLYALPASSTAELESDLMATGDIRFGPKVPGVKGSWTGQEDLFELITNMLSGTPALSGTARGAVQGRGHDPRRHRQGQLHRLTRPDRDGTAARPDDGGHRPGHRPVPGRHDGPPPRRRQLQQGHRHVPGHRPHNRQAPERRHRERPDLQHPDHPGPGDRPAEDRRLGTVPFRASRTAPDGAVQMPGVRLRDLGRSKITGSAPQRICQQRDERFELHVDR